MVAYAPRHGEQEEMPYRSVRRRMALYRPTSSRAQGTRAPQASRLESDPRRPLLRAKERLPLAFAAQGLPAVEDRLRLVQEVALREGTWRRLNALSCVSSCAYVSAGAPSPAPTKSTGCSVYRCTSTRWATSTCKVYCGKRFVLRRIHGGVGSIKSETIRMVHLLSPTPYSRNEQSQRPFAQFRYQPA